MYGRPATGSLVMSHLPGPNSRRHDLRSPLIPMIWALMARRGRHHVQRPAPTGAIEPPCRSLEQQLIASVAVDDGDMELGETVDDRPHRFSVRAEHHATLRMP